MSIVLLRCQERQSSKRSEPISSNTNPSHGSVPPCGGTGVREDVTSLPDADRHHIAGDIKRAYILLVGQWLEYMGHLKDYLSLSLFPGDKNQSLS